MKNETSKSSPTSQKINEMARQLFDQAIENSDKLDVQLVEVGGARVLDFATQREGTHYAGVVLSNICMGSMALTEVRLGTHALGLDQVSVHVSHPLLACMGSQYAGWPVSHEKYFAMCSGPMRMARGKEAVLTDYDLQQSSTVAVGVLEASEIPSPEVIQLIAQECNVDPENLCLCVARTASYPGSIQVVARSVETALHKLHELKFDLTTIVGGAGSAPLPPIAPDDMTALGWTNDAILYGTQVDLQVDTEDEKIEAIVEQIPSSSSGEFGTPFLEIFKRYNNDFYKIDKLLFSPAKIRIHNLKTGNNFEAGEIRNDILTSSFGLA